MHRNGKGGGPIRGFVVSLLAIGLWLVVIAAVAWMVHSTPDSNRSIRRFRRARRSLAPQGRRHRAAAASATGSETSTVVVVETLRRSRANRVIDLRERDPEPRPARWPADGWSLGSVAASGPRLAWATSGGHLPSWGEPSVEVARPPHREVPRPTRPEVARAARPEVARTARLGTDRTPSRPMAASTLTTRPQPRPAAPRKPVAAGPRPATARQAAPISKPRPAPRQVAKAPVPKPGRRINFDEHPHHAAIGQAPRQAASTKGQARGPARWRVIDLTTSEPQERWEMAAGAESQGMPGPLPEVFRLDPLHRRSQARLNEAGSRAR